MLDKVKEALPGLPHGDGADAPSLSPSRQANRPPAVIGATISIKGDIKGEENLIIEGTVEGTVDLRGNDVTVGGTGTVTASVTANVVTIDGEVNGDIEGIEKVIISSAGRVQGNIVSPRVTLEDGAKFKGRIDMDPSDSSNSADTPKQLNKRKAAGTTEVAPNSASSTAA